MEIVFILDLTFIFGALSVICSCEFSAPDKKE